MLRSQRSTPSWAAPFEVVLAVAVLLAAPSLLAFLGGEMPFDAAALRLLAALAVAWVLSNLVAVVYTAVSTPVPLESPVASDLDPLSGLPYPPVRP